MLEYLLLFVGLFFLYKGADWLVDGSSSLAKKIGVSSLVIGLTVVAFGTSLPELIVNIFAALKGNADISYGNIIGSNIANLLLILGITSIIISLKAKKSTIHKEIPFAFLAVIILLIMSNDLFFSNASINTLSSYDGIILLSFFLIFILYVLNMIKHDLKIKKDFIEHSKDSNLKLISLIFGGLVLLYFGGKFTVDSAVFIARTFGISEFLISSTIVAIGTSLPELITSIVAAIKKEMDLSIGNILGSNIFNIFLVLGITSVISPLSVPLLINVDLIFLSLVTLLLFVYMYLPKKEHMHRWKGISFVSLYVLYLILLIIRG